MHQNIRPAPMPLQNSMAIQLSVENSGGSLSEASRIWPKRLAPSQTSKPMQLTLASR